jgi:hypothetical protein
MNSEKQEMNFVLWFAQNLQIGPVSEYTRLLWIMLVEKNVKHPAASRGASSHLLRNPPKQIRLRQGYGGYPFRIHPRPSGRGFLRRRVKGREASIILSCQNDDFHDKIPMVYCVNLQIEGSMA